jgi:hypothetical protein
VFFVRDKPLALFGHVEILHRPAARRRTFACGGELEENAFGPNGANKPKNKMYTPLIYWTDLPLLHVNGCLILPLLVNGGVAEAL